jgi:hypothetical protein
MKSLTLTSIAILMLAFAVVPATADHPGQGGRPVAAELSGDAEVPVDGDLDGEGSFTATLNPGQNEICYELTVDGIEPATAAHIHQGDAGVTGGPVVALEAPADGESSGCVEADREMIQEIIQDPSSYYVNVHNAEYPDGALRGQLSK